MWSLISFFRLVYYICYRVLDQVIRQRIASFYLLSKNITLLGFIAFLAPVQMNWSHF